MSVKRKKRLLGIVGASALLSLTSCMAPQTVSQDALYKSSLNENFFKSKLAEVKKEIKKNPKILKNSSKPPKGLEWYLDAGSIARYAYDIPTSLKIWDFADRQVNIYEQQLLMGKLAQNVAALLINDYVKNYVPPIYERVFLNTYQAINYFSLSKPDSANIELNRAIERLDKAKTIFAKEMEIKESNVEKQKKKIANASFKQSSINQIEKAYSVLDQYKPYQDFANPFVYYLKGIYYYEIGDYANAKDMFKITYGLIKGQEPATEQVNDDWVLANQGGDGKHYAWVIYLNGLTFRKVEKRFDIPVFLFSRDVLYVGIALPWLKEQPLTSKTLYVSNGRETKTTVRLVNMDRLVAWEFKQRLKPLIFQQIVKAVLQAVEQYTAKKTLGGWAQLAVAVFNYATNKADLRQWYWLPKEVQITRIEIHKGDKLTIKVPGHPKKVIPVNTDKDLIIFIRGFKPQDEVLYYVGQI